MLRKPICALLVVLALMTLIAVPPAHAWVECGEIDGCVGGCYYGCICIIYDDATGQYRGHILYNC